MKKILFLDRDGVINKDKSYLYKIEDFEWVEGVKEALTMATNAGYEIIVVTNQSGVARGYYTEEDVKRLHDYISAELAVIGVFILDFYYCPHLLGASVKKYDIDCECRKPKPGMLLQAMEDYSVCKEQSFMIGDSLRDVEAAESAGIRGYLYQGGCMKSFVEGILKGNNHYAGL